MGGSTTIRTGAEKIDTIQWQTSAYGLPIPVVYGAARLAGNLLWYAKFKSKSYTSTSGGGGKGGGGVKQRNTTYKYFADVAMAICEGPVNEVRWMWKDKKLATPTEFGVTVKLGSIAQSNWSIWDSETYTPAVVNKNYSGICYVAAKEYELTDSAQVPNHSFVVYGNFSNETPYQIDAKIGSVINDILTNTRYGASFPSELIDDLTQINTYSLAYDLLISGALTEQQSAAEILRELSQLLNFGIVWGEKLKFIPYADKQMTGNSTTFTPNLTPVYSLTVNDFITERGEDPIRVSRKQTSDAYNHVRIEYPERGRDYNSTVIEAKDQANINVYGIRSRDVIKTKWLANDYRVRTAAQQILQRDVYIRNEYEFSLPWNYALLEPMDLVTITDDVLGFDELPVRITKIEEDDNGVLTITAEDFPLGVANAELYPSQDATGYTGSYNTGAGDIEDVTVFESPVDAVSTGLEVRVAASSTDANYGGCRVWVSLDDMNYKDVGVINGNSRHGALKSAMGVKTAITNADFDGSSSGGLASSWFVYNNSSGTEPITPSIVAGRSGNAQRVTWSVNNTSTKGISRTNAPGDGQLWVANSSWYIRFWAKATGTVVGVLPRLEWNTTPTMYWVKRPALSGSWQEYVCFIRWSASFEALGRVYINVAGSSAVQGSVDIDDFDCAPAIDADIFDDSQLLSGSPEDAQTDSTLVYVNGEYMGYEDATLIGTRNYALTNLVRAAHNNQQVSSSIGAKFVRVDAGVAKSGPLDPSLVGKNIYIKICTFNLYGAAEQSIADVDAIVYTITGQQLMLPPANVGTPTAVVEKFGIRISWPKNNEPDIREYELRQGGSWESGTPLEKRLGTSYLWAVQNVGTYTFWLKARDVYGNESVSATSVSVAVTAPTIAGLSSQFAGPDVRLNWTGTDGSFPIAGYEIRHGASWAAGTMIADVQASTFSEKVSYSGSRTYWVAPFDAQGNFGSASSVTVSVLAHNAVTITSQVVDNNVLLYWTAPTIGSLPVATYEVRRGSTWAGATVIGQVLGRFSTVFEQTGGNFTYWVCAIDTAGTYGTPSSLTVKVDVPPDYLLRSDQDSAFGGTKTNMVLQDGVLYGPANLTETFAQHFTTRSWAGPSDQVTAGYPIYIQPTQATGAYEEVFDYGTTLPGTTISITPTYNVVAGSATITPTISVSNTSSTGPWTDYVGVSQTYASTFRWVKVKLDVAATGGTGLIAITNLNVRLAVKLKNDGGEGTANAADSGGTTVTFSQTFIDVTSITVTAKSTSARYAVYDFTDVPNPTSFKVLLFDTAGARVSGTFSWSAKGV